MISVNGVGATSYVEVDRRCCEFRSDRKSLEVNQKTVRPKPSNQRRKKDLQVVANPDDHRPEMTGSMDYALLYGNNAENASPSPPWKACSRIRKCQASDVKNPSGGAAPAVPANFSRPRSTPCLDVVLHFARAHTHTHLKSPLLDLPEPSRDPFANPFRGSYLRVTRV